MAPTSQAASRAHAVSQALRCIAIWQPLPVTVAGGWHAIRGSLRGIYSRDHNISSTVTSVADMSSTRFVAANGCTVATNMTPLQRPQRPPPAGDELVLRKQAACLPACSMRVQQHYMAVQIQCAQTVHEVHNTPLIERTLTLSQSEYTIYCVCTYIYSNTNI